MDKIKAKGRAKYDEANQKAYDKAYDEAYKKVSDGEDPQKVWDTAEKATKVMPTEASKATLAGTKKGIRKGKGGAFKGFMKEKLGVGGQKSGGGSSSSSSSDGGH